MAANTLPFRISTGLKNIIGRDLITDDYVAVFELVKNSFDAYANKVTITFEPNKIVIKDDGKGMDLDDIKEKWLFVAYSAKKEGVEDVDLQEKEFDSYRDKIQVKRYYAGAKGIGRFSCDRLGSALVLTTKRASANSSTEQIEVNWSDFDADTSQDFVNINVKHRTLQPIAKEHKSLVHGTILEISDLNSIWTREKKVELKKSLEKLINPLDRNEGNEIEPEEQPFKIIIHDDGEKSNDAKVELPRDKVNGEVKNFVFETLKLKTTQILTEIDEKGNFLTISIRDRGTLIYKIRKPNPTNPSLRNIRFHLFFLNKAAKTTFTKRMGIQPFAFGSVFVYKNGFRIAPYGDYRDDSFGLDTRKGQKYTRLGTRDLIGRVEIIGDNSDFREVSSRNAGLVKNEHYYAMFECFIQNCLEKLEDYLQKVSWKIPADKDRTDLSALESVSGKSAVIEVISNALAGQDVQLEELDTNFAKISPIELNELADDEVIFNLKLIAGKLNDKNYLKSVNQVEKENKELREKISKEETERREREEENQRLEEERQRLEEERQRLEEELEFERNKNTYLTASRRVLSDDAKGLIHSIKINTIRINKSVGNLIRKVKEGTLREKDIVKELTNIKFYSDRAYKISKLITRAGFKSNIDKQTVDISKYVEQYIAIYSDVSDITAIEFQVLNNDSSLYKKVSVLELSIVFDDLISNAEKWGAKRILIELSNLKNGNLQILFSDDGKGLLDKYVDKSEHIFELGITETDGSGIGLYNTRRSLKEMNAEIRFLANGSKLSGATFEMIFQK